MDSKDRLARELLASLRSDMTSSRARALEKERRDMADAFEAQERGGSPRGPATVSRRPGDVAVSGTQKRDNKRFTYPILKVMIGRESYTTIDWSLGGFQVKDVYLEYKLNSRINVTFAHAERPSTYFTAMVRIVRQDTKSKSMSLKFERLAEGGFEFLSGLQLTQLRKR